MILRKIFGSLCRVCVYMREGWVWGWYLLKLILMGEDVECCEGCMILFFVKMCWMCEDFVLDIREFFRFCCGFKWLYEDFVLYSVWFKCVEKYVYIVYIYFLNIKFSILVVINKKVVMINIVSIFLKIDFY